MKLGINEQPLLARCVRVVKTKHELAAAKCVDWKVIENHLDTIAQLEDLLIKIEAEVPTLGAVAEETQHWMISVQDPINDYREIQGGYFDGTKAAAIYAFRNTAPWSKYFNTKQPGRYSIVMRTNAIVLQDGESK